MQFAVKLLKKRCVVLAVGNAAGWEQSVVGLLAASLPTVDLAAAVESNGEAGQKEALARLLQLVREEKAGGPAAPMGGPKAKRTAAARAPDVPQPSIPKPAPISRPWHKTQALGALQRMVGARAAVSPSSSGPGGAQEEGSAAVASASATKGPGAASRATAGANSNDFSADTEEEDEAETARGVGVDIASSALSAQRVISAAGPQMGDHVVSHHRKHAFFAATIVRFDKEAREFEVAWDDGDTSATRQPFDRVFPDAQPDADDVGVGTRVLFPQGRYKMTGTDGVVKTGLDRFHEGVVTAIVKDATTGQKLYVGRHAYGAADDKWVNFSDYADTFRVPLERLRIAGNLMAALAMGGGGPPVDDIALLDA